MELLATCGHQGRCLPSASRAQCCRIPLPLPSPPCPAPTIGCHDRPLTTHPPPSHLPLSPPNLPPHAPSPAPPAPSPAPPASQIPEVHRGPAGRWRWPTRSTPWLATARGARVHGPGPGRPVPQVPPQPPGASAPAWRAGGVPDARHQQHAQPRHGALRRAPHVERERRALRCAP